MTILRHEINNQYLDMEASIVQDKIRLTNLGAFGKKNSELMVWIIKRKQNITSQSDLEFFLLNV